MVLFICRFRLRRNQRQEVAAAVLSGFGLADAPDIQIGSAVRQDRAHALSRPKPADTRDLTSRAGFRQIDVAAFQNPERVVGVELGADAFQAVRRGIGTAQQRGGRALHEHIHALHAFQRQAHGVAEHLRPHHVRKASGGPFHGVRGRRIHPRFQVVQRIEQHTFLRD